MLLLLSLNGQIVRGAGGTNGGAGEFLIGLAMMCGGFYMLLNSIMVTSSFGAGMRLYGFSAMGGNYAVTSGMVMISSFSANSAMVFLPVR